MKCLLIFNALNDVVFNKYDEDFRDYINTYARKQGLISKQCSIKQEISSNVIVQIFSPIITSHRVMNCEFSNTYDSLECGDELNIVFKEHLGFLLVAISKDIISLIKTWLKICITVIRFVCYINMQLLKTNSHYSDLAINLLDSWEEVSSYDQAIKLEAVEQLIINADLSSVTLEILKEIVGKIKYDSVHALFLVQNKLLTLYSSQNAKELSSADILMLILLNNSKKSEKNMNNFYLFLSGYKSEPTCVPHFVQIVQITEEISLIVVIESSAVVLFSVKLYEAFSRLNFLKNVQSQRNSETMKLAFHNADVAVQYLISKLKKIKIEIKEKYPHFRMVSSKWKLTKTAYEELIKSDFSEAYLKSESALDSFVEILQKLFKIIEYYRGKLLNEATQVVQSATSAVAENLSPFTAIFMVKALKNFSLESFLGEFPGLVHFIYVDRNNHKIVTPGLDSTLDNTNKEFKKEVWRMINICREHLHDGRLSLMWKNSTFTFSYLLWFEYVTGEPLKPTVPVSGIVRSLPQPGIINGDFYSKLKQKCFPKMSPKNVRCYELYCVHLKIAAPALIMEHMRKLTATVWEIKGYSNHPMDLL